MKTRIHKAGITFKEGLIPNLELTATEPMASDMTLEQKADIFEAEATLVVDALWESLAGGLLDRILVKIMERKVSSLRVRHDDERTNDETLLRGHNPCLTTHYPISI